MPKRGEKMSPEQRAKIAASHLARNARSQPKSCPECQEIKPAAEFYQGERRRSAYCKSCQALKTQRYRKAHPERVARHQRAKDLRRKFGITVEQYEALSTQQSDRCLICDRLTSQTHRPLLDVDHCHECGVIRGLLCNPCNAGLGMFGDDPHRLMRALQYLQQHVHSIDGVERP